MRPLSTAPFTPSGEAMRPGTRGGRGYMLLVAIVMVTILSLVLAMSMIPVRTTATRMRERELVYRGEHIAAGIRRFYQKYGRFPYELDELLEQEPRFIRDVYKDPMSKDGNWTLVYLSATDQGALANLDRAIGRAVAQVTGEEVEVEVNSENVERQKPSSLFASGRQQITGVRSSSDQEGLMERDDSTIYADWLFSALPKKKFGAEELGEIGLPTVPAEGTAEP